MRIAPVALLVLTASVIEADPKPAPIAVHMVPIEDGLVQGLDPAKAERVLRERLARKKSIVLVPEAEGAAIVLRVTELAGWGEKRRALEQTDRPARIPTEGRGIATGSEGVVAVRNEHSTHVSIVVRATWGERFRDLVSHQSDKTIKAAADSVADELERFTRKR